MTIDSRPTRTWRTELAFLTALFGGIALILFLPSLIIRVTSNEPRPKIYSLVGAWEGERGGFTARLLFEFDGRFTSGFAPVSEQQQKDGVRPEVRRHRNRIIYLSEPVRGWYELEGDKLIITLHNGQFESWKCSFASPSELTLTSSANPNLSVTWRRISE